LRNSVNPGNSDFAAPEGAGRPDRRAHEDLRLGPRTIATSQKIDLDHRRRSAGISAICTSIPLMAIWFGVGHLAKIVLILAASFIPVVLNTHEGLRMRRSGLRSPDPDLHTSAD
jgi:hypothetical protein